MKKLTSKELATLEHNINNPLCIIMGFSEVLLDKVESGERLGREDKLQLLAVISAAKRINVYISSLARDK